MTDTEERAVRDSWLRPKAELTAAAKRSLRMRSIREWLFGIIWLALAGVPIWFEFGRTDMIPWYFGLFIVWRLERLYYHIRAIQHRLASMHDEIDVLRGNDNSGYDHQLGEYMEGV